MSEAMKPCPFCGGEAKIYTPPITLGDDDADVDYMRPVCTSCGVVGQLVRLRDHNRRSASYQSALSEAIAAWNTRHTESPLGPVADELELLLAKSTPGSWRTQALDQGVQLWSGRDYVGEIRNYTGDDAELIVALREAAPSLLATAREVEELRAEVERLREIVVRYGDRIRMANAPAELQQEIDEAFARAALASKGEAA